MTNVAPPITADCHASRQGRLCVSITAASIACKPINSASSSLSGAMADTASALGSLGSDLAFSVSFGIGRELLDAAQDAQMSEDELIASVLTLSIVMTALPRTFRSIINELRQRGCFGSSPLVTHPLSSTESGLVSFFGLLVDIAKRIAISLCVQLLAANVRAKQPNRAVRIVSLLSVAIFFRKSPPSCPVLSLLLTPPCLIPTVFLEASSSIGLKVRKE